MTAPATSTTAGLLALAPERAVSDAVALAAPGVADRRAPETPEKDS
ncbi:hypothetical protein ACFPM7_12290 [Actinokineospora guangxiensis]|uniref:Uncharacterized protein n=1 Tax=Actinokineospora guangxiensis TaxID=1490288 RepID=A0ABW0ENG5_9PSEU